jgi:hypothetical protein
VDRPAFEPDHPVEIAVRRVVLVHAFLQLRVVDSIPRTAERVVDDALSIDDSIANVNRPAALRAIERESATGVTPPVREIDDDQVVWHWSLTSFPLRRRT